MRAHRSYAVVAVVAGLSLAACAPDGSSPDALGTAGGVTSPTGTPTGTATTAPTPTPPIARLAVDPAELLGTWRVSAESDPASGPLTFTADGVTVRRPCGEMGGEWRANPGGLFVANLTFFHEACIDEPEPAWLGAAAAFDLTKAGVRLLDSEGAVVATLTPEGGSGPDGGDPAASHAAPDAPAAEGGAADERPLAGPAIPAGYQPASPETLLGRWLPAGDPAAGTSSPSYATFSADRSWSGSDGCNGQGGRWVADATGALLATQGPQTLIGCRGVGVGAPLQQATAAAFDGDVLVLLDAAGDEVLRLHADRTEGTDPSAAP